MPIIDKLRQPEYTGENRCTPCTAVNVAIATAGGTLVAKAKSPVLGTAAFGVSLGTIYLRGYLVPGTPNSRSATFRIGFCAGSRRSQHPHRPANPTASIRNTCFSTPAW
jgi:hypothetical protein